MPRKSAGSKKTKSVEAITHENVKRKNIYTAEFESVMRKDEKSLPVHAYA